MTERVSKAAETTDQLLALRGATFVRCAYHAVLGRDPDPGGLANYLDHLDRGMDKEQVLVDLATSPEGRKLDPGRLPGLKELVAAAKIRNRPTFLSRSLAGLLSVALQPLFVRLNRVEYRIDKLNERERRGLSEVDAVTTHVAFRKAIFNERPLESALTQRAAEEFPVRVDETAENRRWPQYAQRSRLDRRRKNLERGFGREIVSDQFFHAIVSAVRLIADSNSVIGPFLEDAIVARWMLTGSATDKALHNLSRQLSAVFYSAFTCSQVRRTAAEMDTCNGVAARALVTAIWSTSYIDLPITAFMLCVINAHYDDMPDLHDSTVRDRICAEFFLRLVPEYGLERLVTPEQRKGLARTAAGDLDGRLSQLQHWVLEAEDRIRNRFAPLNDSALTAFREWFRDVGVWEMKLTFCLPEEDFGASQMTIASSTGRRDLELEIPGYFFAHGLLADDLRPAETWLHEMVWTRRYSGDFPWRIFAPSIFAYVSNRQPPEPYEAKPSNSKVHKLGCRQLRPGDLLVFCDAGNGPRHLIGQGWDKPEDTHVWTVAHTALLAITLDPSDDGPLDLFLDFQVGTQPDARVSVVWNGHIVELVRTKPNVATVLTCSLGRLHRTGGASNILSLCIDRLFRPSDGGSLDTRTLGLALSRLALVHR
jgi:uncharacterized protein DUF4214